MATHADDIKLIIEMLRLQLIELALLPVGAFSVRLLNQKRMELNEARNELAVWECAMHDNVLLLEHSG